MPEIKTDLPSILRQLHLSDPHFLAASPIANIWRVRQADKTRAVLKLYTRPDRANEGPGVALLNAWSDRGAVRVIVDQGPILLLEYLEGPLLGDLSRRGEDARAMQLLAETAARLHRAPSAIVPNLPCLETVLFSLNALERAEECNPILWHDIRRARHLAHMLLDSQPDPVPLHGDLHHDNVILTATGPKVIDAKGYSGDPAFEMANALRNPRSKPELIRDRQRLRRGVAMFAEAMSVDPARLSAWVAVKCALSICWRADGKLTSDKEQDLLTLFLEEAGQ